MLVDHDGDNRGDRTQQATDGGEESVKDNNGRLWHRRHRQGREATREERQHLVSDMV